MVNYLVRTVQPVWGVTPDAFFYSIHEGDSMSKVTLVQRFAVACLLVTMLSLLAFGQTSASLSGTVHDPQGKALVGAKVSLSNTAGTTQLDTTTNGEGFYTFPVIQPGNYTVTIEAAGFKKLATSGIVVNASDKQSTGITN